MIAALGAFGVAGKAAGALTGIASGIIGSKKRKAEQRAAQGEFDQNKQRYEGLDTSNQYANMENTMEDLTVNTQQADMANQQNQQNISSTMSGMNAAAGGSGIAGLAQAMAQQGASNTQQASASIGAQESRNQMAAARQAGSNQMSELQGAEKSRAAEKDKTETMLGMSQARLGAANEARDAATQSIMGGIGQAAGGVDDFMAGVA
tara:strand:- start:478 stop:1095 length:618 start_codon:yes stop_codon:yes gene_type:complete